MNYKIKEKVSRVENTTDVGNAVNDIGSGATDRFNNIYSVNFRGDSTSTYYGDLAERYTVNPDVTIPMGTVMEISSGEFDSEICDTEASEFVIGILSKSPGFELNTQLENAAVIGLVGRVPVRAIGPVYKKDILVSAGSGCVRSALNVSEHIYKVAVALETNEDLGEKLILSFVK